MNYAVEDIVLLLMNNKKFRIMEYPQTINLNVRVKVTLTRYGAQQLNKYNMQYHLHTDHDGAEMDEIWFPTHYKEDSTYESELGHVMEIFGSGIHGSCIPFKNNEMVLLGMQ